MGFAYLSPHTDLVEGAPHSRVTSEDAVASADGETCPRSPSLAGVRPGIALTAIGPPEPALFTILSSDTPTRLRKSPFTVAGGAPLPSPSGALEETHIVVRE